MHPFAVRSESPPTGPASTSAPQRPPIRCRLRQSGDGNRFSEEITALLRNRLKIVAAIALFPSTAFLIKNAVLIETMRRGAGLVLALQAVVVVVTAVLGV